ncbi:hypothetical protein FOF48_05725 [Corallococcus sp. Z5C101001]|nr:hypothetical protein [Corallococcus silvisoli]TSC33134.1 hypothetical protein FOF48_05725 [Corallococcus sp. Z5C101001]
MVRAVSTLQRLCVAVLAASALLTGCLPYSQNEGEYELIPTETLRDDCGLLARIRGELQLNLQISGRVVRADFGVENMQLLGFFLEEGQAFTADGSVANVSTTTEDKECLLDQVRVHLDATTVCSTQFSGQLRLTYDANNDTNCTCELWLRFDGVQDGTRCGGNP